MSSWQDITTFMIVGAAVVYCGAQLLLIGKNWTGGGSGCSKGCNTCPAKRAEEFAGSRVQSASLVQISRPGKQ